eukprot:m.229057 g.229057  ORF g.229057 m.229057 type:complete len:61 (-) comp15202_c0_seq4:153-335(-)
MCCQSRQFLLCTHTLVLWIGIYAPSLFDVPWYMTHATVVGLVSDVAASPKVEFISKIHRI